MASASVRLTSGTLGNSEPAANTAITVVAPVNRCAKFETYGETENLQTVCSCRLNFCSRETQCSGRLINGGRIDLMKREEKRLQDSVDCTSRNSV